MRILGNYGTVRVGATAGYNIYWNRQWSVNYKAASATLTKTVKMKDKDLSAFYVMCNYEKGDITLKISQGNTSKTIELSSGYNEKVDMASFSAGLIKMNLTIKSAKKLKAKIGWRR